MVKQLTNAMSLTGRGLRDWLIQRVTSVVMLVYIVFLLLFIAGHRHMDDMVWQGLFSHMAMRVLTSLFLLSLIWHAWVGMWTIVTDYVKPLGLRLSAQVLIVLALIGYFVWGLAILWMVHA